MILSLLFCLINSSAAAYVHNIALRHPHFLRAGRCCLTEDDEESVEVTAEVVPDEVDAAEVVEQMRILSEADEEEQLLLRSLMKKKMAGMSDAELKRIADDLDGGGGDLIEKINALQGTKAGELYESLVDEQDIEDAEPEDPRNGQAGWGRWSHNDEGLSLELFVPEETGAKDITCEVQVGFLDVRVKDEPLLSGRLAAEVKRLAAQLEPLLAVQATLGELRAPRSLQDSVEIIASDLSKFTGAFMHQVQMINEGKVTSTEVVRNILRTMGSALL